MGKLESEGAFTVKIEMATCKPAPKETDPNAFTIALKGVTSDDLEAWGHLYFGSGIIERGKYMGKTTAEMNMQTLRDMGVEDGHPANLQAKIDEGLECEFVMALEEYNGTTSLKVKYINAVNNAVDIKEVDFNELIAKLKNGTPAEKKEPAPKVEPTVPPPETKDDGTVEAKVVDDAEKSENDFINAEKKDGDEALDEDEIPF